MSYLFSSKQIKWSIILVVLLMAGRAILAPESRAALPDSVKAVYLPPHCFTERKVSEFTHYARLAGLNAAVLHVKDPHGWIRWNSKNQLARKMGAVASNGLVEHTLRRSNSVLTAA